jgi:hypothetical protein
MLFVKIDRITGNVLKTKNYDVDNLRPLNKAVVWIPFTQTATPAFDEEVEKLVTFYNQPDLSDLSVDVSPTAVREMSWNVVALTAQELQGRVDAKVSAGDSKLIRAVELLFTKIATGGGVALQRSDFPNAVWNQINALRALRGDLPI